MVEIEPYEFKKKTNIEEHNDIVDKVNEIVGVINDTQMDTIDTRLTAVEGDVTALESEVSSLDNELATKADKSEIPDTSTFATKTEVDAVDTKVDAIDSQLDSMQTEIDGKLSSVPIGGNNIGGVKNGGNVTINADGTMNASGTGTGINENVLTYAGNKLKSTVNGVDSNEVEIIAGGGGVSSVVVTNPSPGNITVNVDGVTGNADIDTLASGVEVYGSEFPADSGNASAYIKLNDSISTGEIGKYTESGTSFIRIGNEDTRLLADIVELRNEVPDEGCKLTSGANGELLVNGVAMKNYTLPVGGTALGGVKNGGNVTIDAQGNMNAPTTPAYTLPVASANTLGGVKIGSGVSVSADGTISVRASGGITFITIPNGNNIPAICNHLLNNKLLFVELYSTSKDVLVNIIARMVKPDTSPNMAFCHGTLVQYTTNKIIGVIQNINSVSSSGFTIKYSPIDKPGYSAEYNINSDAWTIWNPGFAIN